MSSKGSGGKGYGLSNSYQNSAVSTRSAEAEAQLRVENGMLRRELALIKDEIETSTDEKLKQWLQEFLRQI